ncbi:xanthine dehydrogenase family protein molybdopterin-binding subunit [Halochromatium sp.]
MTAAPSPAPETKPSSQSHNRPHIKRGVGMAAANWFAGDGGRPSTVIVRLFTDGTPNLNMGASDIGTGTKTVMAMVLAEELGIAPERVQIENADTGTTQFATPSGGSTTVPTEEPTVRRACLAVKDQLLDMAAQQLELPRRDLVFVGDRRHGTNGQLVGGVTMGVGFASTDMRVIDGPAGKLCNKNWHDYKLPTALDVPAEVTSVPIALTDEQANIVGAKGLGEPVTIPTAAAIANALFDAVGVRLLETPINPLTLVEQLHAATGAANSAEG